MQKRDARKSKPDWNWVRDSIKRDFKELINNRKYSYNSQTTSRIKNKNSMNNMLLRRGIKPEKKPLIYSKT